MSRRSSLIHGLLWLSVIMLGGICVLGGFFLAWSHGWVGNQMDAMMKIRDLQGLLLNHRQRHGALPERLEDLRIEERDEWVLEPDHWGNTAVYLRRNEQFVLVTFGSDRDPDFDDYWAFHQRGARIKTRSVCWRLAADQIIADEGWVANCGK